MRATTALLIATMGCSDGATEPSDGQTTHDVDSELSQTEPVKARPEPPEREAEEKDEPSKGIPARLARRRVRRWDWQSAANERAELWNLPIEESRQATITGLFHICIFEANWNNDRDCIGIWQVLNNVRSSDCNRKRIPTITECDEDGETILSAMRRAQKMAMGIIPPKNRRHRWIRNLSLDCDEPEGFPADQDWEHNYRRWCERMAGVARGLVTGKDLRRVTGRARPLTWGGRCEDDNGACDDPLACRRGLARIEGTGTQNAFWCRPGTPGCTGWVEREGRYYSDEICADIGMAPRRPPRRARD